MVMAMAMALRSHPTSPCLSTLISHSSCCAKFQQFRFPLLSNTIIVPPDVGSIFQLREVHNSGEAMNQMSEIAKNHRDMAKNAFLFMALKHGCSASAKSGTRTLTTCRDIVLPRFGGPEVLEVRDNSVLPGLRASDVLVRTHAVGVNPLDIQMREGYGRSLFEPLLPLLLDRNVSGEVTAVGNCVQHLQVGDQVFGALHPTAARGTYSEYAIFEEEQLAPKPESLPHTEAAAIPFASLTAWRALRSTANIQKGQKVLVMGGGRAVGLAAIYLAKAAGCYAACTCGKRSMEKVKEAGAEEAVDYTSSNLKDQFRERFDVVLDTIGVPESKASGISLLQRGGKYLTLQGEAVAYTDKYGLIAGGAAALFQKQMKYRRSPGIEYWWPIMRTGAEGLEEICRLASDGRLKIPVGQTFPLEMVAEAHRARDGKNAGGKAVLEIDQKANLF